MKTKRSVILPILLIILMLVASASLFVFRQKNVTLLVDGASQNLVTHRLTVSSALQAAGVTVTSSDIVQPSVSSLLSDGMQIVVQHAVRVTIQDGEKSSTLTSAETTPLAWLQVAGITLGDSDRLFVDGIERDPSQPVTYAREHQLLIHHPVQVTLIRDGLTRIFTSTAQTVAQALKEAGITLYPTDRLDPPGDTQLNSDRTVTLLGSRELAITVAGKTISSRASAGTVGAALAQVGLSLQGLDYSLPAAGEPVPADGHIRVVRVVENITQQTEIIPFDVSYQAQSDLDLDTQKIIQYGVNGLAASRTRIRYEGGVEVGRVVEGRQVLNEPVTQVEGFGTRITVRSMDTPDGPIEYYRAHTFYATAYYPDFSKPPYYGAVACGGKWQPGYVSVDLDFVPCGTRLYIPGYGFGIAMDTAYIYGAWIDLGYYQKDYKGWHWNVTVYFLAPVPPENLIHWVIPPGRLE
jgi:uncharacterized protein YabE (DUF348 family)